jgi:putative FmdB family regulatory protein
MPFYEYECQDCKYYIEVMQKITDAPLKKCPSCGKPALKKLVSAPVFRLKGGGWYETDFKSDKENKRNLVGADKDEPKVESKPDAKDAKEAKPEKEAKVEAKVEAKEAKPAEAKSSTGGARPRPSTRSRVKPKKAKSARRTRR